MAAELKSHIETMIRQLEAVVERADAQSCRRAEIDCDALLSGLRDVGGSDPDVRSAIKQAYWTSFGYFVALEESRDPQEWEDARRNARASLSALLKAFRNAMSPAGEAGSLQSPLSGGEPLFTAWTGATSSDARNSYGAARAVVARPTLVSSRD